jgi:hypothetical protein
MAAQGEFRMHELAANEKPKVERRCWSRRPVHAAVAIDASDRDNRIGVTRNLSAGGVLFHTASRFQIGEYLDLTFRGPPVVPVDTRVRGRVVRACHDVRESGTLFPHVIAVEFEEPLRYLSSSRG